MHQAAADQVFDDLEERESPRLIKTHYPFELLPPGLLDTCKVGRQAKQLNSVFKYKQQKQWLVMYLFSFVLFNFH